MVVGNVYEEPSFLCCSEDLALWSDWEKEGTWGTEVVLLIALALFKFAKASKLKGNSRR